MEDEQIGQLTSCWAKRFTWWKAGTTGRCCMGYRVTYSIRSCVFLPSPCWEHFAVAVAQHYSFDLLCLALQPSRRTSWRTHRFHRHIVILLNVIEVIIINPPPSLPPPLPPPPSMAPVQVARAASGMYLYQHAVIPTGNCLPTTPKRITWILTWGWTSADSRQVWNLYGDGCKVLPPVFNC